MANRELNKVEEIIRPVVEAMGYELWGCDLSSSGRQKTLRVYLESPAGISLDDCTRASKQIGAILDVEDPILGRYVLEISSPGIERPLFTVKQYQKYLGELVYVRLFVPHEDRRNYTGYIKAIDDEYLTLDVDGKVVKLLFSDFEKARLVMPSR
jgi:ribosome maturation factor RimP